MRKLFIIITILLNSSIYTAQTDLLEQACLNGSLDMVKYHIALLDKTLPENAYTVECLVYKIEKEISHLKNKQKREAEFVPLKSLIKAGAFYSAAVLSTFALSVYGNGVDLRRSLQRGNSFFMPRGPLAYYFAARALACLPGVIFPNMVFPKTVYQEKIDALMAVKEHLQGLVFSR